MKPRYSVLILLTLIVASAMTGYHSFSTTRQLVTQDMSHALARALEQQQTHVISADTVRVFNNYLQLDELRGKAVLAVDTRQRGFRCYAKCSAATIFSMSDQRPASVLWMMAGLWGFFCLYRHRKTTFHPVGASCFGGLSFSESDQRFFDAQGQHVKLTPMQQQLMEMFFRSPSHLLTKSEICEALWPKKDDASETLYTLIRRLKPVIEQHSDLKIEADRGRAYELKIR